MTRSLVPGALRRFGVPLLLAGLLGSFTGAVIAADETPDPDQDTVSSALVQVDGRTILRVWGSAGYPANERARAIERRIVDLARNRAIPVESITLKENERGTAIQAGEIRLLTVTDGDAALEETNPQTLALATLVATRDAVQSWRFERSTERRLRNLYWTIGATVVTAFVLWLLGGIFRRIRRFVAERASARIKSVGVQSFEVIHASQIHAALAALPRLGYWLAVGVTLYVYLDVVLKLFPLTRPLGERLFWLVVGPLETFGLALVRQLPNLFFLAVLVVLVRYALKVLRLYFDAIERGAVKFSNFDADWAIPTYKVLRIFVVAFAIVVAYPYIPGSESAAFKGVSVMLGVLFSLGSSSVISNIIAGYSMTYRRAFRRGDRIKVGDIIGEVVEPRVLVTTLRTPKNEIVIVPNSEILNNSIVNYSTMARETGVILHTTVGIGYETPWRQVEAMLLEAARRTPGLNGEPSPFVLQRALGDFCVTYEINAYTSDASNMLHKYSALHANILDVFNEYGVQIMTPAYEGDPAEPKVVRTDDWFAAPAVAPAGQRDPKNSGAAWRQDDDTSPS